MSGPTPDTPKARAPIERKAQLIDDCRSGTKPKDQWRIGTEHEKFPFLTDTLAPVPYDGPRSIRALLEGLRDRFGWEPASTRAATSSRSPIPRASASISLEPGGQFELSGAPLATRPRNLRGGARASGRRCARSATGSASASSGSAPRRCGPGPKRRSCPRAATSIMAPYMDKVGKLWPRHDVPHLHGAGQSRLRLGSRHGEEAPRVAGAAAHRHRAVRQFAVP